MPGHARKDIVREGEVATYHCWSRCVQKAHLCGHDPETGRDFNYRRGWIEDLLAYQARVFALDVGNYNLLSNHAHTILRTRPDIAASWSHEELALRWKLAWPEWEDGRWIREPTEQELDALLCQPEKFEQIRKNLSSLSWFMARWKEPIAKKCNREMDKKGHFWEARFGSRELLDDEAVLACSVYVDLNQVRSGMADSLEDSQYSAIRNRILAAKHREALASLEKFEKENPGDLYSFSGTDADALFEDCWLAPINVDGPLLTTESLGKDPAEASAIPESTANASDQGPATVDSEPKAEDGHVDARSVKEAVETAPEGTTTAARAPRSLLSPSRLLTRRRLSDSPFIDVPWAEYLRVVKAVASFSKTGDLAADFGGPAGETLEDVLTRWGINAPAWLADLDHLDRRCTRALGAAHRVVQRAGEVAQRWIQGVGWCREIFADASSDPCT